MTDPTPAFLAQRLAWVFRKSGGSGQIVRTFEEVSPEIQGYLRTRIDSSADEVPVLAAFANQDEWVVLTTDRLVSCRAGQMSTVPCREIHDATIAASDLRRARGKNLVAILTVVTSNGDTLQLDLESGSPLSGVWNVLKTIGAGNRRNRP